MSRKITRKQLKRMKRLARGGEGKGESDRAKRIRLGHRGFGGGRKIVMSDRTYITDGDGAFRFFSSKGYKKGKKK